jgi:hypothetical protein
LSSPKWGKVFRYPDLPNDFLYRIIKLEEVFEADGEWLAG